MPEIAIGAAEDQRGFYDARYAAGYMQDFGHVFEATRLRQVDAALGLLRAQGAVPARTLDYGCGEGRWFETLERTFPSTAITGCDISPRALELARAMFPRAVELSLMQDERTALSDASFDLVVSVEVLEHVADVRRACGEIGRLVAPGGWALITTPCANRFSLEWIVNRMRGGLQPSADGFGRFATDEPSHLRRLRSADLCTMLTDFGLVVDRVLFSGHLFTTLMGAVPGLRPKRTRAAVGMLDWRLLRRWPNGSTMVVLAHKR
ncbi:MAG: class I SAM-dependent methyltransferase [Solirubrobacteraceae bacterium]